MSDMFFAGIPIEGSGTRPLDADLYGADQQGFDAENISATGNLNVGNVMRYDEHAQRNWNGGIASDIRPEIASTPDAVNGALIPALASAGGMSAVSQPAGNDAPSPISNYGSGPTQNDGGPQTGAASVANSSNTTAINQNNTGATPQTPQSTGPESSYSYYNTSNHSGDGAGNTYNNTTTYNNNITNTSYNQQNYTQNNYINNNGNTVIVGAHDHDPINITIINNDNGHNQGDGGNIVNTVTNILTNENNLIVTTTNQIVNNILGGGSSTGGHDHGGAGEGLGLVDGVVQSVDHALTETFNLAGNLNQTVDQVAHGGFDLINSLTANTLAQTGDVLASASHTVDMAMGNSSSFLHDVTLLANSSLAVANNALSQVGVATGNISPAVNDVANLSTHIVTPVTAVLQNAVDVSVPVAGATVDALSHNSIAIGNIVSGNSLDLSAVTAITAPVSSEILSNNTANIVAGLGAEIGNVASNLSSGHLDAVVVGVAQDAQSLNPGNVVSPVVTAISDLGASVPTGTLDTTVADTLHNLQGASPGDLLTPATTGITDLANHTDSQIADIANTTLHNVQSIDPHNILAPVTPVTTDLGNTVDTHLADLANSVLQGNSPTGAVNADLSSLASGANAAGSDVAGHANTLAASANHVANSITDSGNTILPPVVNDVNAGSNALLTDLHNGNLVDITPPVNTSIPVVASVLNAAVSDSSHVANQTLSDLHDPAMALAALPHADAGAAPVDAGVLFTGGGTAGIASSTHAPVVHDTPHIDHSVHGLV